MAVGESGEDCREPMPRIGVYAELVVVAGEASARTRALS
jgi:hypothetical protein